MKSRYSLPKTLDLPESIDLTPLLSLMMQLVPLVLLSGTFFTIVSISAFIASSGKSSDRTIQSSNDFVNIRINYDKSIEILNQESHSPMAKFDSDDWQGNLKNLKAFLTQYKKKNETLTVAFLSPNDQVSWDMVVDLINAIKTTSDQPSKPLINQVHLKTHSQ